MSEKWTSAVAVGACLLLLAVVAVDRRRLRKRLDATEGAVAGLRLDLAAARERVEELHHYLSRQDSWAVDAAAPESFRKPVVPDRWTPPGGAAGSSPRTTPGTASDSSPAAPTSG